MTTLLIVLFAIFFTASARSPKEPDDGDKHS